RGQARDRHGRGLGGRRGTIAGEPGSKCATTITTRIRWRGGDEDMGRNGVALAVRGQHGSIVSPGTTCVRQAEDDLAGGIAVPVEAVDSLVEGAETILVTGSAVAVGPGGESGAGVRPCDSP